MKIFLRYFVMHAKKVKLAFLKIKCLFAQNANVIYALCVYKHMIGLIILLIMNKKIIYVKKMVKISLLIAQLAKKVYAPFVKWITIIMIYNHLEG